MTNLQRIQIAQSENREAMNELLNKGGDLTDDDRAKLGGMTTRAQELEIEQRAAIVAEGDKPDVPVKTEDREFEQLITRSDVGLIFDAAMGNGTVDGATRELQEHFGMSGNRVPLALIQRAVTPIPTDVGADQTAIIMPVFPQSAASWLGVDMPTVGVGESVYTTLDTDTVAADYDASAVVTEPAAAFTASVLSPRRISASFRYQIENRAKLAGMDSALRQNLSEALSAGLDNYVLNKTDLGLLEFGTDPTAGNEETFATYRTAIYAAVDGRYANGTSGVRILVGSDTYRHMASVYRANTADDSALDSIMRISGGVRVSAHVAAMDATAKTQHSVVARGMEYKHAVAPIWDGIEIIFDNITSASKGEIVLTAIMLMNCKVVRAAGYQRNLFKVGS